MLRAQAPAALVSQVPVLGAEGGPRVAAALPLLEVGAELVVATVHCHVLPAGRLGVHATPGAQNSRTLQTKFRPDGQLQVAKNRHV